MRRRLTLAEEIRGTPLATALASPARLLADPAVRLVKDHRRTAVGALAVGGRALWVKRFKPYAWYRRIERTLGGSPARRSWENSLRLGRAGFGVAAPLACVEEGADSWFITAEVEGALSAGRFWMERRRDLAPSERHGLVRAAARLVRRLHDAGFYSRDANADNFLVRPRRGADAEFFLLDLENVRTLTAVSRRRRMKNLVQFHRPLRDDVRGIDRLRFVAAYLGGDRSEVRRWIGPLSLLAERKDREYRRRREARVAP